MGPQQRRICGASTADHSCQWAAIRDLNQHCCTDATRHPIGWMPQRPPTGRGIDLEMKHHRNRAIKKRCRAPELEAGAHSPAGSAGSRPTAASHLAVALRQGRTCLRARSPSPVRSCITASLLRRSGSTGVLWFALTGWARFLVLLGWRDRQGQARIPDDHAPVGLDPALLQGQEGTHAQQDQQDLAHASGGPGALNLACG